MTDTSSPSTATVPLRLVTAESALVTVFNVLTGGAFLTGLALLWGANDFQIGLLVAIPFITPVAQLGSAYLINRTGARKKITVTNSAIARHIWWLILPFLFIPCGFKLELLLGILIVCSIAVNVATVGWTSWMSDLVPEGKRGRFFATRNMAVAISTFAATIIGGAVLDHFHDTGRDLAGFAVILAAGGLFAFAATMLLRRTPDCKCEAVRGWEHVFEPLRIKKFRKLLGVFFVWNLAIGVSAPFVAPHMITNLGMSFTLISMYNSAAALMCILLNRPWGALIDRFGCKPVISLTSAGIALIPIIWLLPTKGSLWILIPEVVFSASLWAGFNLAAFNIPIANSPNGKRTSYLALFSMITGAAFFGASVLGGLLAESLSGMSWHVGGLNILNYHVLFIISAVLRFSGGFFLRSFRETDEKRVVVMLHYMLKSIVSLPARVFIPGRRQPAFTNPPVLVPEDPIPAPLARKTASAGER